MRSDANGIALLELLIAVIFISALGIAYMSLHSGLAAPAVDDPQISAADSAFYAALDEISLELRMAILRSGNDATSIKHLKGTDRIYIKADNRHIEYKIDEQGRLVRQIGRDQKILATGALSLRTRELGRETIVLTLLPRPAYSQPDDPGGAQRSYSRIVAVNLPLSGVLKYD